MNYNSSCSPLLERLRAHAIWQEQKKIATAALLETNISPTLRCLKSENNESCDSPELSISNKEVDFLRPLHLNSTTNEIDTKNISNLDENLVCSEDISSSNCSQKFSSANDQSSVNESVSKFNYLRRGQGLKRFNSKKLKGFHKTASNKIKEQSGNEIKLKSALLSKKNFEKFEESVKKKTNHGLGLTQNNCNLANNASKVSHRNFDAFEVLEELVEHDSFISTSSRVNYLFQEDCSTPVPMRKSSFEHMDLTPITQPNEKSLTMAISNQVTGHNLTPVRSLFSGQSHQSYGFNRNIRNYPAYTSVNAQLSEQTSMRVERDTKFISGNNQSGILKKFLDEPSFLLKSSNSVPKVHFPNNGARILEYNEDPQETINETICSEDTDLVNISDLENLKFLGLNYNFEIVHEVSSSEDQNLSFNQVFRKTSMNLRKSQVYESPKSSHKELPNNCPRQTNVPKIKALSPSSKSVENLGTLGSYSNKRSLHNNTVKASMGTKVETEQVKQFKHGNNNDIEVNKLLLLSKVYDLKKEIKMFKSKNETMDKLIQELEDEKKNLITSQDKARHQKMNISKYSLDNIKKKNYNVPLCKNDLDQKIKILNERICNLKTENNLLKRKVVSLNKKERELIKKPNISTFDDNKTKVFRKKDVSLSAGKEDNRNLSLVPDKKTLNHQIKAGTMDSLAIKVDENENPEEIVKENGTSEVPAFDSDKVNKPTYVSAVAPNITIPFQENNSSSLTTKHHPNGDIQIYYPDKIIYFHNKEKITQTRFKEGKEIIEFQTGQKEIYFPDGSHQIIFPDKSCISVYGDGTQNIVSVDGTSTRIKKDGTKVIEFPNGQKEIYQNDIIERIYPDGTVKLLYADGMQETRYKNGKIRIKTKDGGIIMK